MENSNSQGPRSLLRELSEQDPEELLRRLEAAVGAEYDAVVVKGMATWPRQPPPFDVFDPLVPDIVSYLLDYVVPEALERIGPPGDRSPEIRKLARELTPAAFIFMLFVYAAERGDLEGARRAWTLYANRLSPYWRLLERYRSQSSGGIAAGAKRANIARNRAIRERAVALLAKGKPEQDIAGILARQYSLSDRMIRNILRETEMG